MLALLGMCISRSMTSGCKRKNTMRTLEHKSPTAKHERTRVSKNENHSEKNQIEMGSAIARIDEQFICIRDG
jgi:hypothetical protein